MAGRGRPRKTLPVTTEKADPFTNHKWLAIASTDNIDLTQAVEPYEPQDFYLNFDTEDTLWFGVVLPLPNAKAPLLMRAFEKDYGFKILVANTQREAEKLVETLLHW